MGFLQALRELSVERCERYFFPLNAWSVLEWAGAAAGEAGETANVAKKMRRYDVQVARGTNSKAVKGDAAKRAKRREQLAEEVADTVIYLDLLCASEGIDLEEAIRAKFNKVSEEHGYEKRL